MKYFNYDFKTVSHTDYEMKLDTEVKGSIMTYIFKKAKNKVSKKIGKEIKGNLNDSKKIIMEKSHLRLLKTIIRPLIAKVAAKVRANNIIIISYIVKSACFNKTLHDWRLNMDVEGVYSKGK